LPYELTLLYGELNRTSQPSMHFFVNFAIFKALFLSNIQRNFLKLAKFTKFTNFLITAVLKLSQISLTGFFCALVVWCYVSTPTLFHCLITFHESLFVIIQAAVRSYDRRGTWPITCILMIIDDTYMQSAAMLYRSDCFIF